MPRPFVVFGWAIDYDRLRQWVRENGITCRSCGQEGHVECDLSKLNWNLDLFGYGEDYSFRISYSAPSAETPVESRQYFLGITQEQFSVGSQFTLDLMEVFNDQGDSYDFYGRRQRLRDVSNELSADYSPAFHVGISWDVDSTV